MKGLFTTVALLILFSSCKESGVQLSKPSTFVRYFSDGNQNEAVDVLQTSDDGFLILSYSKPSNSSIGWINLTKTDVNGNSLPVKTIKHNLADSDLQPSNFVAYKDVSGEERYLIVGTVINPKFGSRLFVARTNNAGDLVDSISYYHASDIQPGLGSPASYLKGRGVAQTNNATKDFFVLAQAVKADLISPADSDMYLAQIVGVDDVPNNKKALSKVFTHTYGAGATDLANRLYYVDGVAPKLFWGGTTADGNGTHMILSRTGFNAEPQNADWFRTYPQENQIDIFKGNDICSFSSTNFAFIGSHYNTQITPNQYDAIDFSYIDYNGGALGLLNPDGSYNLTRQFQLKFPQDIPPGASICPITGGFLLLFTQAMDAQGTNTDYALIKLDGSGNPPADWPVAKTYGGKYPDVGKRVLQSRDGGYVVLGTTKLANVNTVFFMKTDGGGNIQ